LPQQGPRPPPAKRADLRRRVEACKVGPWDSEKSTSLVAPAPTPTSTATPAEHGRDQNHRRRWSAPIIDGGTRPQNRRSTASISGLSIALRAGTARCDSLATKLRCRARCAIGRRPWAPSATGCFQREPRAFRGIVDAAGRLVAVERGVSRVSVGRVVSAEMITRSHSHAAGNGAQLSTTSASVAAAWVVLTRLQAEAISTNGYDGGVTTTATLSGGRG